MTPMKIKKANHSMIGYEDKIYSIGGINNNKCIIILKKWNRNQRKLIFYNIDNMRFYLSLKVYYLLNLL